MTSQHPDHEAAKVWFITGCCSGLGRALAHEVIADGARLIATARDTASLDGLVAGPPTGLAPWPWTSPTPPRIARPWTPPAGEFGRIDVLVNNAGYGTRGAIEEVSDTKCAALFDTNVFGLVNVTSAVAARACAPVAAATS